MLDTTHSSQRGLLDHVLAICDSEFYYVLALVYTCTMSFGLGMLLGFVLVNI
jgi:hypothetical protein